MCNFVLACIIAPLPMTMKFKPPYNPVALILHPYGNEFYRSMILGKAVHCISCPNSVAFGFHHILSLSIHFALYFPSLVRHLKFKHIPQASTFWHILVLARKLKFMTVTNVALRCLYSGKQMHRAP